MHAPGEFPESRCAGHQPQQSCVILHGRSWERPFWFFRANAADLKMCNFVIQRTFCKVCRHFCATATQSAEARDAAESTLSCTRQLLTTKNHLAQYVRNAQFEKFCSKWGFSMSCLCVAGHKCLYPLELSQASVGNLLSESRAQS